MTRIQTTLRRLFAWLTEQEPRSDMEMQRCDWADLPPHHPCK